MCVHVLACVCMYVYMCMYVCMCVCAHVHVHPPPMALVTRSMIWCDIDPVQLVKQVVELFSVS